VTNALSGCIHKIHVLEIQADSIILDIGLENCISEESSALRVAHELVTQDNDAKSLLRDSIHQSTLVLLKMRVF